MNYILELQVSITISKDNPSYILHHIEPIVCDEKPNNKYISEAIRLEREFVEDLLGFKPYRISIRCNDMGMTFTNE